MFGRDYESIPSNLDDLHAGPELGGVLACIDVDEVSPYDRIVLLRAHQRQASHQQALVYQAMTSVLDGMDDDNPRSATESAAAEIRAALRLTRTAADTELAYAMDLQRRLPRVWAALAAGDIDVRRAKTILRCTDHLATAVAQTVVERIIDAAPNLTTGELKARLDRLCIEADPESARDRYQHVVKDRRVVTEATTDGTANLLGLDLAPHRIHAISRRINHLARSLNTGGETRTMDQLRADVFIDLLGGKNLSDQGKGGGVHLQADLDTLAALAEHPGELVGYGPVIADIARQAAQQLEDAEWRFSVTDTAHRPNRRQRGHPQAPNHHTTPRYRDSEPDLCLPRLPHAVNRL